MKEVPAASRSGLDDEKAFESSLFDDPTTPQTMPEGAAAALDEDQPWAGKRMGHFRLLRSIGSGSMGRVFQAVDVNLQRIVALKVLRKQVRGAGQVKRINQFLREARAAAQIEHPNIVRIFEIAEHEGWWYIAMEMIEGESLENVVKAAGPLPLHKACPVIADAATALAVAHEAGIVHRDVKPSNIMITRTGRAKLADFGLARVNDPNDPFETVGRSVGTPKYMAPEIIEQKETDDAVDIYALGGTLWFAMSGKAPYNGKTVTEVLYQHVHNELPNPEKSIESCTHSLGELLRHMLAKDPEERPTASDVAAALRAESIGIYPEDSGQGSGTWGGMLGGVHARRAVRRRISKRRLIAATIIICLVVGIAAPLWVLRNYDIIPPPPLPTPAEWFPDQPQTYGRLEAGQVPTAVDIPAQAPPYSWVGRVDPGQARFVASKRGRHFWPIQSPQAALITAEDFVGYADEAAARGGGKLPAP